MKAASPTARTCTWRGVIMANGSLPTRICPFNLDGWISSGTGKEYDGYLNRGGKKIEAYAGNSDINQIER